jgi:uncharacterized LabA/DUF88 family protein
MLTVDAITLALNVEQFVIVSDDEDFTPAAIASLFHAQHRDLVAVIRRRRHPGSAPNDQVLLNQLAIRVVSC